MNNYPQTFQLLNNQNYPYSYESEEENVLTFLYSMKKHTEENICNLTEIFNNYKAVSKESNNYCVGNEIIFCKNEMEIPSSNILHNEDTEIKSEELMALNENLKQSNEMYYDSGTSNEVNDMNSKKKISFVVHKLSKGNVRRKRGKYNMCDSNFKEMCIEESKITGNLKEVVKKYGVPLKKLKRWLQVGANRQKGGGRKVLDPNMEVNLLNWYYEARERNEIITGRKMQNKAKELSSAQKFLASKGWLEKFLKKFQIQVDKDKY